MTTEPMTQVLRLLKRQSELETAKRSPGGIRITEDRELNLLRARLCRFPHAPRAPATVRTRPSTAARA